MLYINLLVFKVNRIQAQKMINALIRASMQLHIYMMYQIKYMKDLRLANFLFLGRNLIRSHIN